MTERLLIGSICSPCQRAKGRAEPELKEGWVATRKSRPIVNQYASSKSPDVPGIRLIEDGLRRA